MQVITLIPLVLFYAFLSYGRNMVWVTDYALWRDAIENSPLKPHPHINIGVALLKNGYIEEAVQHLKVASRLAPQAVEPLLNLGSAYLLKRDWDNAIAALEKAVSIQSDSSLVYSNLGLALANKGLYKEAIARLQYAVFLWPDNYAAHKNLAIIYEKLGFFHESEREAEIAKRLGRNVKIVHGYEVIQELD